MRWTVLLLVLLVPLSGCLVEGADPEVLATLETLSGSPELRLDTTEGTIRLFLYDEWLPNTTARISELTESGFYDATQIHRIVDDFVLQGGDPTATGSGGSGQTMVREWDPRLVFGIGALGMAREADPDSADSQWFITEKPALHLSDPDSEKTKDFGGVFTLFGQVFEGMDVVRTITGSQSIEELQRPLVPIVVLDAEILSPPDIDWTQYPSVVEEWLPDADGADAYMQHPMYLFAGHESEWTLVWKGVEDGPGDHAYQFLKDGWFGLQTVSTPWVGIQDFVDPTTWAGTVTFPSVGTWHLADQDGTDLGMAFEVLPWHEDYAAFTG